MNKYLILSVVIIGLLIGFNGHAVDFNVTITDDTVDANLGDGLCLDSNGECSLRTAINQSNFLISDDVIYLPRGEMFELTLNDDLESQFANDLEIYNSMTLSITNPEIPLESESDRPLFW